MKTFEFLGNKIIFSFNSPVQETGYISEDFDFTKKSSYATLGVQTLLKFDNDFQLQFIIGEIFKILKEETKNQKLDYLQIININNIEIWCIDNGDTICLLTKEEY
ncbi:MAG: hypothetical protein PHV23_01400 [Candidatus Gracilibacteria bacterium]|nr:hypothetical protein [Candidatus Gracilibacteria bacterium]